MKNNLFAALILASLSATSTHVQAEDAAPTGFKLKNHSSFKATSTARNPFWPVGWAKTAASTAATPSAPAAAPVAPALKAEDFVVTSILLNEPPLAVVNGKALGEGELFQMEIGGQKLVVQLASVQDGQVVLRYQNRNFVVPLRRKGELPASAPSSALPVSSATASR